MSSGWSEPSAVHHGGYQEQYDRSLIATWSGFFPHSYCLNGAHVISIKTPTPIPDSPAVLTWGSRLSAGTTCRQEGEGKEVGMVQEDHDTPPPNSLLLGVRTPQTHRCQRSWGAPCPQGDQSPVLDITGVLEHRHQQHFLQHNVSSAKKARVESDLSCWYLLS